MNWIFDNKDWLFSGIGVVLLTFAVKILYNKFYRDRKNGNLQIQDENSTHIEQQNVNVNVNIAKPENVPGSKENNKYTIEELKIKTNVLFVDDESFKIVNILKKTEGWINTKSVKDIKSLTCQEIRWANIIFVDINGVGATLFNDQGLGLAKALKEKYPEKKIIIYSAESLHDAFSDAWKIVDDSLPKNADPIQFIAKVEKYAEEINNE